MKKILLLILFLTPLVLFAQEEVTIFEGEQAVICGKILRLDGIWVSEGRIKADISIREKKMNKPIIGGYGLNDTIEIKSGCTYYIKLVQKFGLTSDKGYVSLINEADPMQYLGMALSNLNVNDKIDVGGDKWQVMNISKDAAEFEITEDNNKKRNVMLAKNDITWHGFTAYYISDFLANSTDAINNQWTIELKKVKDYSYLSGPSIPGEDINAPLKVTGATELVIRKMKFYPKQKFNQEEYDAVPVKYWVLKVYDFPGGIARQMIEIVRDGKKSMKEFDAYKSFDTEAEVLEFAKVNGITDVKLKEE